MTLHPPRIDTSQKAFQLNLDNTVYGTLAEIGTGQEAARWFFRVGGTAGTVGWAFDSNTNRRRIPRT